MDLEQEIEDFSQVELVRRVLELEDVNYKLRNENVAVWRDRNKWFDAFMELVEERVDDEWDDDEDYV